MPQGYNDVLAIGELSADVASVIPQLRDVYWKCKNFLALTARFSNSAFQDEFDRQTLLSDFDGGSMPSQMIYQVNQLVTSWEGNPNYRAVIGI
jgi:hypothetical protein